ncbi:MAG: VWA domain-containing protein [Rhodanobacteraceae bacterium]
MNFSEFASFHFLRPAWLVLLLALPLLQVFWRRTRADAEVWRSAVDAHLLPHLLERGETAGHGRGLWLAGLVWALISIALAGPTWEREALPLYRNQAARVLALELSPTMLCQDVKPSRLERARFKLDDILKRSRDRQTALIAYAGDAFVAAPLTDDEATVRNLVDSLDPSTMPVAGNATARAIDRALALVRQAGLKQGELILLADSVGPDAIAAAQRAHEHGLIVSVLGIGSAAGAPVPLPRGGFLKDASGNILVPRLDQSDLRALAEAGGGRYAHMSVDASDIDSVLIDTQTAANVASSNNLANANWRDRGPWLLLLVLPLALLGFRRGWLMSSVPAMLAPMSMALLSLVAVSGAHAASLTDLWMRPDQQAAAALANGDAKHAAAVAKAPAWRASAEYRTGDYAAAAENFAHAQGADAAYNRGNALARQGRYKDALAAYSRALELAPGMADAKANRKAVEDWLKRQPKSGPRSNQENKSSSSNRNGRQPNGNDQAGKADKRSGGQEQNSRNDQSQQGKDQSQSGAQGQQSGNGENAKSDHDANDASPRAGKQANQHVGKPASKTQAGSADAADSSAKPESSDETASAAQKKALSKAIDRALAKSAKPQTGTQRAQATAAHEDEAAREKRQALDQWLERVPDDPGGLLRRKFLLEYQRRQQDGGAGQ